MVTKLEDWKEITLEEIVSVVGYKHRCKTLTELLAAYFSKNKDTECYLYIPDRAILARYIPVYPKTNSPVFVIQIFIPRHNATLNITDYSVRGQYYKVTSEGLFVTLDEVDPSLDTLLTSGDMKKMIENYYHRNKGFTVFDPLAYRKKFLHNLIRLSAITSLVGSNTYSSIIAAIKSTTEGVVCDAAESEKGIYYLDRTSGIDVLMFAQVECLVIAADYYFVTKYYKVEEDLSKMYIPACDLELLLDTVQLVIACHPSIPTEETCIRSFDADNYSDVIRTAVKTAQSGGYRVKSGDVISFNEHCFHLESVGVYRSTLDVKIARYTEETLDFILTFGFGNRWLYNEGVSRELINNLNLSAVLMTYSICTHTINRKVLAAPTIFDYNILYIPSSDTIALKAASEFLKSPKAIIVSNITPYSVVIYKKHSELDVFYNIIFYFDGDDIVDARCSSQLSLSDVDGTINDLCINDIEYIPISLIKYIRGANGVM